MIVDPEIIEGHLVGLELVGSDRRSGCKLEFVFVSFNEVTRIKPLINYYSPYGDIVILDGGSTDGTQEAASEMGATVLARKHPSFGELHFVHYLNSWSSSGRCLSLQCDELIAPSDLIRIDAALTERGGSIAGARMDWLYCVRAKRATCVIPRGGTRGSGVFSAKNLHDTLSFADVDCSKVLTVEIDHLHVSSIARDYGKIGNYFSAEVAQLCQQRARKIGIFLKFLWWGRYAQLNVARFIRSPWICFFYLAQFVNNVSLLSMALIENRKFPSSNQQVHFYNELFERSALLNRPTDDE